MKIFDAGYKNVKREELLLHKKNEPWEQCVKILRQGLDLIERLDDDIYAGFDSEDKSCIGSHFRHNLDFLNNFLNGIESGKIDYNRRERNFLVETNREYAISRYKTAIEELKNLDAEIAGRRILVSLEAAGIDGEENWCGSSVLRELEFLSSHLIHHYALIAVKLSRSGFEVPKNFGVSPSTLQYWKNLKNETAKAV